MTISNIRDDPHVSIVSIISSSWKLNNRSWNWWCSCFYSGSFSISHPLVCISSPWDIFIIRYIPCTVSSDKSSTFSTIFDRISTFESSSIRHSNRFFCWCFCWYWCCFFWSCFCKRRLSLSYGSWDYEITSYSQNTHIRESIHTNNIIHIDRILGTDFGESISFFYSVDYSWDRRDFESCSRFEDITCSHIICPKYSINTNIVPFWKLRERISCNNRIRHNNRGFFCWCFCNFFDFFIHKIFFWARINIESDESSIWNKRGIWIYITICRNDRRFIIVNPMRTHISSDKWKWRIDRKKNYPSKDKNSGPTKGFSEWMNLDIVPDSTCDFRAIIWEWWQRLVLGIKN